MRLAMAQPCLGSRERVFRIRTSRAPWMRLLGLLMRKPWLSTIVDNLQYGAGRCQGLGNDITSEISSGGPHADLPVHHHRSYVSPDSGQGSGLGRASEDTAGDHGVQPGIPGDRKSTRLNSSHLVI